MAGRYVEVGGSIEARSSKVMMTHQTTAKPVRRDLWRERDIDEKSVVVLFDGS